MALGSWLSRHRVLAALAALALLALGWFTVVGIAIVGLFALISRLAAGEMEEALPFAFVPLAVLPLLALAAGVALLLVARRARQERVAQIAANPIAPTAGGVWPF